ncbi:HNH endonuclease domain protein [Streptomyces bingchenggensis BCW-1]|uniref:HNH endonuclease domain protein n=1 Tax=Streptomyces bingchenggensis (strain BCW-1) TaxID=749414 RepID=D7CHB6_STRBB|nr:RNA-guided endonuclease IscB [Streptomyces bingchenggensis]ADI06973.1 HNH endonuclease domain protein [Streptomyces bingchenggensis BCW-1]
MPPSDSHLVSLVFPPEPVWVRAAREAVRTLLAAADRRDLADTALLLTSEAVTNSVNACLRSGCSTPVTLFAEWTAPHVLRVLVQDEAPGLPVPRAPASEDEHGRGLARIAAFTAQAGERRGRYSVQLDHRGAVIRKKLAQRAAYRRRRRTSNLRYRAPRFNNRTRPDGWLAPSPQHRVTTTVSWVTRLSRWAPVRAVHVERVAFDTHAISAGRPLAGAEYQHGTLHGTEAREYLLAKFGRACAYCGITEVPLNIDHVHPRSRGGSDRISNLVTACIPCNETKSNRSVQEFVRDKTKLAKILAQAKAPLRDAAAVQSTRWALWRALDQMLPTHIVSGGRTKWNRTRCGLPKSHTLDALDVGKLDTVTETITPILVAGCSGRGQHQRTSPDRHGFPRRTSPRVKAVHGYATGDLVTASVPKGKYTGTHTGRVMIRTTGRFDIRTAHGLAAGIRHTNIRLLQRGDGYTYTHQPEPTCT